VDDLPASKAEWLERLTRAQYRVLRRGATEPPYSGRDLSTDGAGTYRCVGCTAALFSSAAKYHSGSGWPAFWGALPTAVTLRRQWKRFLPRTEIGCGRCASHLGHVFVDPASPSGLRYCINSLALRFTCDNGASSDAKRSGG
jgi:peptide-methionine (R)-S-oxide reductase